MRLYYRLFEYSLMIFKLYFIFKNLLYFNMKPARVPCFLAIISGCGLLVLNTFHLSSFTYSTYDLLSAVFIIIISIQNFHLSYIGYGILGMFLVNGLDTMILILCQMLGNSFGYPLTTIQAGFITMFITFILWIGLIYHIRKKYLHSTQKRKTNFFVFISLASIINSGIYYLISSEITPSGHKNKHMVELFMIFFGVFLISEVVYIICLYYEKTHHSIISDFTQEYLELEKKHFTQLQEKDADTRKFRHDMREHFNVMTRYAQSDNLEKLKTYVINMNKAFAPLESTYKTGNDIVDSILNNKNELLKKYNITLNIDGDLTSFHQINDFDLCTLFTNAFQNAIEACMKVPAIAKRHIHITFNRDKTFYVMKFQNTVHEKVAIKNNQLRTSKSDKRNHGFGLIQIKQVIDNHNGRIIMECEDNEFTLTLKLLA